MRRFKMSALLVCSAMLGQFVQTAAAQQSTMQFKAARDTSIDGWENHGGFGDPPVFDKTLLYDTDGGLGSEEFSNAGYRGNPRGKKGSGQHEAIIDWDTEAIKSYVAANADPNEEITYTINLYPMAAPGTDIEIHTLESVNDWVEGNGGRLLWGDDDWGGSFVNFNWEPGTLAVTTNFAQTAYKIDEDGDRVLDLENSIPWVENETGTGGIDDSQYSLTGRGDHFSQGSRMPDFINTEPFYGTDLDDAVTNFTFASTPLDAEFVDALLNDPLNRGIVLGGPRDAGSNWRFWSRESSEENETLTANIDPVTLRLADLGEPVPSPLAPFIEVTFTQIEGLLGDFDKSGELDLPDVNMLNAQIAAGSNDVTFDLNEDSLVDSDDLTVWVKDLRNTWIGDANLDGEFNTGDLVAALSAGKYEQDVDAGWEEGDWTGDLRFDTGDLVASLSDGGFEAGPRAAVAAVPEPSSLVMLLAALLGLAIRRRS